MNQSRLPAAECGEPCALVSGGKEGGGMCRSKSPDHAVIRSDLNGGQGIFELGSILALSGVSVAKVWAFEQQRFECIFAITEH